MQEKLVKDNKIFLRKKKKKSNDMVVNVTKISQEMKKINRLSIEKSIIELQKTLYYNYKAISENFGSL